jgi:hypothetical protein
MLSKDESLGRQPNSLPALVASAIKTGGSPGRLGASFVLILVPETRSTDVMTSRTEAPRPVPKFAEKLSPPERKCRNVATWASARLVAMGTAA